MMSQPPTGKPPARTVASAAPQTLEGRLDKIQQELVEMRSEMGRFFEAVGGRLLLPSEAAPLVGKSEQALLKAAYRGSIKSVRVGKAYMFRRSDLIGGE